MIDGELQDIIALMSLGPGMPRSAMGPGLTPNTMASNRCNEQVSNIVNISSETKP